MEEDNKTISELIDSLNRSIKDIHDHPTHTKDLPTNLEVIVRGVTDSKAIDFIFSDKMDDTIILMKKLREELGVMVSMDDFGSGYSSLNVLTKLPLDVLKLDKDFLKDFENDPDEKIIIPSVIDMAKKLNLSVVCEGVETKEQVAFLQDVGCDYAQGYFYSKPIPVEQFNELLEVI